MDLSTQDLKKTPLADEHKRLGAKLAPFGGWLMPIQYDGIIAEHDWTRKSCSLFDICHMGEFIIHGAPGKSGLNKIVTINLDNMAPGTCHYGFMLNEKGGIIDDLVTYRVEQEKWMLVVNAATTDKDQAHIKRHLSKDCRFENASERLGKLDLQGPLSRDILIGLIGAGINELKYYRFGLFSLLGDENIISRTGYTGELGYEIYISSEKIIEAWKRLLKNEKIKPAGLGARDTLRLEMGYPLYGQDIDEDITPLEAGLEYFIDFDKEFIGKDALLKKKDKGLTKKLIYFITDSRRAPRHGYKIYSGNKQIGDVSSGSFSPSLSCGIGMGYVETGFEKAGSKIIIKDERVEIPAAITDKPFYKKGSLKS
jgi:aminomethyltransferase